MTQQPQPMPPAPAPTGWIALTVQGNQMTSNMIAPSVRLNGHPVPANYGPNLYPVPPGRWHVDIHCTWLRRYGEAALDCDVAEGRTVPVFYASPFHMFRGGEIGHEQQKRRGVLGLALSLSVALIVVVIAVIVQLA